MPVPDKGIVSDEFQAVEATEIPPVAAPDALGANRMVNVTLCPRFRLRGRFNPVTLNPVPVTVALEIVTGELLELVRVAYCDCVAPTCTLPKLRLDGLEASAREVEAVDRGAVMTNKAAVNNTGRR
jgi:hypothetical protein